MIYEESNIFCLIVDNTRVCSRECTVVSNAHHVECALPRAKQSGTGNIWIGISVKTSEKKMVLELCYTESGSTHWM